MGKDLSSDRGGDRRFFERALELAKRGVGRTSPNPPVGAVLVCDGDIVGRGWHKRAGGDHAETAAIKDALRNGCTAADFARSTLYVTLEPCSRAGRVGACTDAIAAAGVGKVFYAAVDPNPVNRGRARRALAKHSIPCELWKGSREIAAAAKDLIRHFAKLATTGLPYVTVKLAMTLDGRICDVNGDAKWISSEMMRKRTGRLRETAGAVMVGAGTVRADDPSLLSHGRPNPRLLRAVVSRSGRLPRDAKIFTDAASDRTLVFRDPLEALRALARLGVMHVVCEGGMDLAVSLARAGLVDEWIAVLAPKVLGGEPLSRAVRLENVKCLQDW